MGQVGLLKKIASRQFSYIAAALAVVLLVTVVSNAVSAARLQERSIMPSTASISAEAGSVQYTVQFTPETAAEAFVVDFCANTPLIGQSCTPPVGLNVSGAATDDATIVGEGMSNNKIVATQTMTANDEQTITFTGLTNPTTAGVMYARIVTYATSQDAQAYTSTNPGDSETVVDSGSVAMYFNDSVNVYGTVLETLTFCVSSAVIDPSCGNIESPVVRLGLEVTPGVYALQPGLRSEGTLHTQINTNAINGAVVRLKSSAMCGGLKRPDATECDIAAAGQNDVPETDAQAALFGMKLGEASSAPGAAPTSIVGTLRAYERDAETPAYYSSDIFAFRFNENNEEGVTSPFGDPFLDTAGAPATNMNMPLTFGATVINSTPAGQYSTDLSMIAVGKF